ncbi:hypothetical protein QAD02_015537, partial [Eretmocerus hayati]
WNAATTFGQQGPIFLLEPPSTLVFSNTTGSQLSCSAHGSPPPLVTWITSPDQRLVSAVPGLRQLMGNGTLYFPPFLAQDFRAEIHNARYRCRASNSLGTVLSREVTLRAVLTMPGYEVRVSRSPVVEGNNAMLSCAAREDIKEHLTVTSWYRDESILLPGSSDTDFFIVWGYISFESRVAVRLRCKLQYNIALCRFVFIVEELVSHFSEMGLRMKKLVEEIAVPLIFAQKSSWVVKTFVFFLNKR